MTNKIHFFFSLILIALIGCSQAIAQKTNPTDPNEIIKKFTQKETELLDAWKEYAYQQESKLQVIGLGGNVAGEFYQVSDFVFSDDGKRIERIVKAPMPTLENAGLQMTTEDRNALTNLQPFALTAQELPNYRVTMIGKEKIDDLNCYVFDVVPKAVADPKELGRLKDKKIEGKFFQGKIWVDDQDLQIVKTAGKVVPEFKQRFPKFETYRENIDGKFWFPTYTYGDDTLNFDRMPPIHVRTVVRYKNYRRFSGDVKIREILEDPPAEADKNPKPKKP